MIDTLTAPRGQMFANPDALPENRLQVAWDSTSLGLLKECPRKYYYTILLGWRPKAESVHLTFGRHYHKGLETYDHFAASIGKLDGALTDAEHDAATIAMLRKVWDEAGAWVSPKCPACHGTGLAPGSDTTAIRCELCEGTGTHGLRVWQPWRSDDPNKNMYTLARSLVWYTDQFRGSPLTTVVLADGRPAVELSFYFEVGEVAGYAWGLCGHLDRMAVDLAQPSPLPCPHDRKTTKGQLNASFWRGFAPHNQFNLYVACCSVHYEKPSNGIIVDAAQVLVNSTAFARQFIPYPPGVVNEWLTEAQVWVNAAAGYAELGFWPRNDKSCGNYGGCPFTKVCSKTPAYRQEWLTADFVYAPWNPLLARGDI